MGIFPFSEELGQNPSKKGTLFELQYN